MTKRWFQMPLVSLLALGLLVGGPHAVYAAPVASDVQPKIDIKLDGVKLPTPVDPIQYKSRTMVPFRAIGEALGLDVQWEEATQTVIATGTGKEVRLQIGNQTATVNHQPVALDAEPVTISDRTLIPIRFLSEQFGATVGWDESTQTVLITSQPRQMDTMVFYGLGSYEKRGYLPKFNQTTLTWSILDTDGSLNVNKSEYHWPTAAAEEFLQEVKTAKVGTQLMVFSENKSGELTKLMQSPALQQKFANDLVKKLQEQGLDSAMLDFETLGAPEENLPVVRAQYAALVKTVADTLHKQGKKLSVVMSPLNGWYKGYDYKAVAQSADQLFIMAYSYVSDKLPQPNDRVQEAIELALQEVPREKLTLGINAYSETPESVKEKIGLAKRYNLQGVGFWILVVFDPAFMQAIDDTLILHDETKDVLHGG